MNRNNMFVIAIIASSLAAVNADSADGDSCSSIQQNSIPGVAAHTPKQQQDGLPSPGIYLAAPYSCIVIVPESVDPAFEHKPGDTLPDDCVISPHSHLEPIQPIR